MADKKCTATVSRSEFYSTVALLLLFPALLFLGSGSFPDTLLRQIAVGLTFLAMIGGSVAYSIMAVRERGRQAKVKEPEV